MSFKIKTLSDLVRAHVHEGILTGEYAPGQRLREVEIAERLGVSRSPIREAIKVLADEGLIVSEPWKGLMIAKLSRLQTLEIFVYREVLEGLAAELACDRISAAVLDELENLTESYVLSSDMTLADLSHNNQDFHQLIYEATENEFLLDSVGTLKTLLALLPSENYRLPGRTEAVQREHRAIVRALRQRDHAAAKEAAHVHVRNSATVQLSLIVESDLGLLADPAANAEHH